MSVREHTFPSAGPPPSLEVRNPAGTVAVTAVEGADRIDVRVEALDGAAEQLLATVDVSSTAGDESTPARVRVVVPERWLFRTPRFAVTVTTPAACEVRVAVASADALLRGPMGEVSVSGASGDVEVERADRLQVRSASGDVGVGAVNGHTTVATASGDARVTSAGDGLEIRTASGDVVVGRAAGHVTLGTASGDVAVSAVEHGTVRLKTVSGDANVGVVAGQRVWLELSSVSGRMRSELDGEQGGGSGPATVSITARTVSGDVRVTRAVSAPAR
jgi:DUF4097 and DUF4098 domain-containing protein YvlB